MDIREAKSTKTKVVVLRSKDGDSQSPVLVTTERQDIQGQQVVVEMQCCKQGHAIHNEADIGGVCVGCGAVLCATCAKKFQCRIDNNVLCRDCCYQEGYGDKLTYICNFSHGRFDRGFDAKLLKKVDWSH
jgi:O-phosphoseryl-tRNA(Cys) synthetase